MGVYFLATAAVLFICFLLPPLVRVFYRDAICLRESGWMIVIPFFCWRDGSQRIKREEG